MKILTSGPVVIPIAQMALMHEGILKMTEFVGEQVPACFEGIDPDHVGALFPHSDAVSDNELLIELAGRKCYNSFGAKAGRKSNREYIENTQQGDVPHSSIMYHAKMSFFVGGISRRVSHELIRHYVGADRDEEGSPSQESTRYIEHPGFYIAHPAILEDREELDYFASAMSRNYAEYLGYIERRTATYARVYGNKPAGMDRKRIFESASPYLSHSCATSFIWTTNPVAIAKMLKERDHEAADLEYLRLAKKWKAVCLEHWPNAFPQPWMRAAA